MLSTSDIPLAHLSEDGARKQTLSDHLTHTAQLASTFAEDFGASDAAYSAGYGHDIGKGSNGFQKRLLGGPPVDHSTAGAQIAFQQRNLPVAFAIAGHHCGIPDGGHPQDSPDSATLLGRNKRNPPPLGAWAAAHTPKIAPVPDWVSQDNLTFAFFTRILYSCLVDADFIDTETFMNGEAAPRHTGQPLRDLLPLLRAQASHFLQAEQCSPVAQKRNDVLRACCKHGQQGPQGLYTLTVPTGGGKTFSSLAFAMEHAIAHGQQRIIYVIPYTSIIDQTVRDFSELLGKENVLAHYSGVDYKLAEPDDVTPAQYRQLLASENWDAPIVVTTAVQFFESLYSNRSSRCRKLHNIANSVVIFDEAQTIPNDYLRPCVSAIAQLVEHYRTTAVLCTATQPALSPLFHDLAPNLVIQEISPNPAALYETLRRTTLCDGGKLSVELLCEQLSSQEQVLCVVNRRKTAQDLYAALPPDGSYCLTTLLCAADRRAQLDEIRERLKTGQPCRVVSTSLIEAGVDVDFPTAYRELAGLDSILQTAGRCNREGKRSASESMVFYFTLADSSVPQMIHANVSALRATIRRYNQIDTPDAIHFYFQELYGIQNQLDKKGILDAFQSGIGGCLFPFAQVAERFQLIESPTRTVYLPIGDGAALCERLRLGFVSRSVLRQLGIYSVACYKQQFDALNAAGALEVLPNGDAILADPDTYYSHETGLSMDVETGVGLFW